jgi:hypothetical protein
VVNAPGVGANLQLRLEEPGSRMMKPRASRTRRDETTPYPSSKHCRELREELSCSSHWSPASPSVRIDSSSCGSRLALPRSSAHREPYMPSPEPRRTPTIAEPLRIGVVTSLDKNIPRVQNPMFGDGHRTHVMNPRRALPSAPGIWSGVWIWARRTIFLSEESDHISFSSNFYR